MEFSLSPLERQRLASLLAATATLLGYAGEQVDEFRQGDTVQPPWVPPQRASALPGQGLDPARLLTLAFAAAA